jgi:hypothetical protein
LRQLPIKSAQTTYTRPLTEEEENSSLRALRIDRFPAHEAWMEAQRMDRVTTDSRANKGQSQAKHELVKSTGAWWRQISEEINMLNRVVFAPDETSTILGSREQPTVAQYCCCLLM